MQHTLNVSPPCASEPDDSSAAFNVLIAYEDFETGKHAKKTYDFLVENLGHECQFANQMWKFDVLAIPKLREIAVQDAAAADLIIISSHGDDLPPQMKTWIESWLAQSVKPLALVALSDRLDEQTFGRSPARAYLANAAKRGRLEFFAQPDEWPGRQAHPENWAVHQVPDMNQKTLSALSGAVQHESRDATVPRWGINE